MSLIKLQIYISGDVHLMHKPEHRSYFKGVTELYSCGSVFVAANVNVGSLRLLFYMQYDALLDKFPKLGNFCVISYNIWVLT